jgi:hypothetical protein
VKKSTKPRPCQNVYSLRQKKTMTAGGSSSGSSGSKRDESVQFSLKELLKLEDERLAEQTRERAANEVAIARERAEAARRREEEAKATATAEKDAETRLRRSELDELARREAMQKAVVEQSRLEVEIRARAQERELERRHELELQRLRGEGQKGQLGTLTISALLGGAVMLVVMLSIHFGVTKPTTDRRIAELQQNIATAETRSDELGRRADDQKRANETLEKKLSDAQAEIASLKNKSTTTTTSTTRTPGVVTTRVITPPPPPPPPPEKVCLAGDPLCPTIARPTTR